MIYVSKYTYMIASNHMCVILHHRSLLGHSNRGYRNHTVPETDSDGDGGTDAKLPGRGHIEFSGKGIPHGILHFPEQIKSAGHIFMHDTCAPEASHRQIIKKAMDRVRKTTESETMESMIDWQFRIQTWNKIIDNVKEGDVVVRRRIRNTSTTTLKVFVNDSKLVRQCFPLRRGGDTLISNDARISHHELATLISNRFQWDIDQVQDRVQVKLFTTATVVHPSGLKRTFWATDTHYPYNDGVRRDMVEVDLGGGNYGVAQITSFIEITHPDIGDQNFGARRGVVIRWMSKSSRIQTRDDHDRPMCDYPLTSNHCLWEWSDSGSTRQSFRVRGFLTMVNTQELWCHVRARHRQGVIDSEIRARYDVIEYTSIRHHANISVDPSTGHMLQTLQMV